MGNAELLMVCSLHHTSVMGSQNIMNIYVHNMLLVTGMEVSFAAKIGEAWGNSFMHKNAWHVPGINT